jgi:hypothetical protein
VIRKLVIIVLGLLVVTVGLTIIRLHRAPETHDFYDGCLNNTKGFVYVNVPYVHQGRTNDCAKAAVSMVLQYHSFAHNQKRLDQAFVGPDGAMMCDIMRYLDELGITAVAFYPTNDASVVRLLQAGLPVLIPQSLEFQGKAFKHLVVLIGMNKDFFVIHDPSAGRDRLLRKKTFESRWILNGMWTRKAIAIFPYRVSPAPYGLEYADVSKDYEFSRSQLSNEILLVESLQKVVSAHPDFLPAQLDLGFALGHARRYSEAEQVFLKVVNRDRAYCWGAGLYGLLWMAWERGDAANYRFWKGELADVTAENRQSIDDAPLSLRTAVKEILNPRNASKSELSRRESAALSPRN